MPTLHLQSQELIWQKCHIKRTFLDHILAFKSIHENQEQGRSYLIHSYKSRLITYWGFIEIWACYSLVVRLFFKLFLNDEKQYCTDQVKMESYIRELLWILKHCKRWQWWWLDENHWDCRIYFQQSFESRNKNMSVQKKLSLDFHSNIRDKVESVNWI